MKAENFQRIQEIFGEAADLPRESQARFVEASCAGNEEIARGVLAMLQEDAGPQCLLDEDAHTWLSQLADATLQADHIGSLIQRQIGPYRLVRVLGEGGMGIVYLAERTDIGGLVAIKLLRDAWLSPMRRERFALEQQILVKLNHPAIARIYDANTMEDGTPWFVMEFADGLPFSEYLIARNGTLREDLLLFRRLCEAIGYAHSHAIIHRDIKPSNIIVNAEGEIKLLDFGIAKQIQVMPDAMARTTVGLRLLTPGYAAPEQSTGGDVGVFTDVYSLGVLLYETLTGLLPEPEDPRGGKAPEKPSSVARAEASANNRLQISKREWADLDVVCLKALQLEPERRYGSVDALMRDVTALLEGRVLEARPSSFTYTAQKFVRRNRLPLVITVAALCLMAGFAGVFTVHLAQARNAALAEAARMQRLQQFMLNMLGAADVEAAPSNDLKVVTLLDRELQQAASLGSDKDTQADLYWTIGTMYSRLAKYEKAEQVLTQALEREKQVEVPPGVKQASILLQLATVQGDRGETKEAKRTLEQVEQTVAAAHLKSNNPLLIQTRITTGRIDLLGGDYQAAVDVLLPVANLKPDRKEISVFDLRDAVAALAEAELYTRHYDLAEATSHRAIELDRQLLGETHPQSAVDLMNLGAVKATIGDFAAAESLYRKGVDTMQRWYGGDHPDVITASTILARVLIAQGKTTEAEATLKQNLEVQKSVYGPVHDRVAFTLNALGELELKNRRPGPAEGYLKQAAEVYRSLYGNRSEKTAASQSSLGAAYLLAGKNALAEMTLRQAVETLESLPPGNYIGLTRGRLGRALLALKRYREAEEQLTLAEKIMEQMPHAPSELANVRTSLANLSVTLHQPSTSTAMVRPLR